MISSDEPFQRFEMLLGPKAWTQLSQAHVVVAGLGAVGSFAAETLARSGVGNLRVIDYDVIEPSNINRQLYALHSTIGKNKAQIAETRIRDISPLCNLEHDAVRLTNENLFSFLQPAPDVVIDAIDKVCDKVALICACLSQSIPIVSSMGAARRINPLAVTTGTLGEIAGCPLARRVKKGMRKAGHDPRELETLLDCIYSTEPPEEATLAVEERHDGEKRAMGSSICVTGVFGLLAAHQAMQIIVRKKF